MKYRTACCDSVVESRHRHDFKTCPCGETSVDGGNVYQRVLFGKAGPPIALPDAPAEEVPQYG